jgi:hypothetical protein
MNKLMLVAGLAVILAPLGACAGDEYARSAGGLGVSVAYADGPMGYDGYYDDAYGPFYDGYWGGDGAYYYSSGEGQAYHRDGGHHFRHDSNAGFHPVHGGQAHGGGMHGSGGGGQNHH